MGPPISIDGNPAARPTPDGATTCFNGAADKHRRKPLFTCECRKRSKGFNGAADKHRRKQQQTTFLMEPSTGFNGAADKHRRKPQTKGEGPTEAISASMGPPISIDGNLTMRSERSKLIMASMGPPISIDG